jgi:hypothetical protein
LGKYDAVMHKLTEAPLEPAYQEKLNAIKDTIEVRTPEGLARIWFEERAKAEKLENELKSINHRLDAVGQLMHESFEEAGVSMLRLEGLGGVRMHPDVYTTVSQAEEFYDWLKANGYERLMTLHYQTRNGLAKDRLLKGQEQPPGLNINVRWKPTPVK